MTEPGVPGADPSGAATSRTTPGPGAAAPGPVESARRPRPILERIGLAFVALVLAALFAVVAVASFSGGELFLAVMGAIGCLMVLWVGGLTLFRG